MEIIFNICVVGLLLGLDLQSLNRKRILVAEHGLHAREMFCELLQVLRYGVLSALASKNALALHGRGPADMLLPNLTLSNMSRSELAHQAVAVLPDLKIVLLPGYGQLDDAGFTSKSLPKPYSLDDLQQVRD